jgi:hypothetical protein
MGQLDTDRDMPPNDSPSLASTSPSKHLIWRIAAVTLLVVAVRVAVTVSMTGGTAAPVAAQRAPAEPRIIAVAVIAPTASVATVYQAEVADRSAHQHVARPETTP